MNIRIRTRLLLMNLRICRAQGKEQERLGRIKNGEVVPSGEGEVYTTIGLERDTLGFKERTLLLPDRSRATLCIDHAVARQVTGRLCLTQEIPYQAGMIGITCQ